MLSNIRRKNKDNKEIKKGANEYDDVLGDDATKKDIIKPYTAYMEEDAADVTFNDWGRQI